MTYRAPVDDIVHALKSVVDLQALAESGVYAGLDEETIRQILEEAGRFGSDVLDPLNWPGDRAGSKLVGTTVETPPGWKEAYKAFAAGGWSALPCPEEHGGQGLPSLVSSAVSEIWNAANMAFGLCPLLTQGAIDALDAVGSAELKSRFLPKMISGEWTGTMNLTEPQAGSDLAALRSKAVRHGDGTYRITGTKIYITYGEHELTDNIIHMVLARLPDAPAGTRGISLFLVPKWLVNADGSRGARNDVICAGLEHKLGIHASPTCTMKYGEQGGAIGYLVGEENKGLAAMFIMMNAARLAVGVQGVSIADRATQRAIAYARDRKQGKTHWNPKGEMAAIIEHPDVRRNLLMMQSLTNAARTICLATAVNLDISHRSADEAERKRSANLAALLTPVAKAWSTDIGVEVASIGIQVHGGMGFVEETGAAQHLRDARILPIYEGTNGIQAIDLVMRKLPLEGGQTVKAYISELKGIAAEVAKVNAPSFGRMGDRLSDAVASLERATAWMGRMLASGTPEATDAVLASAQPYLRLFGVTAGGLNLAKGALAAHRAGQGSHDEPIALARFFAKNVAVEAPTLERIVTEGGDSLLAVEPARLSA
jgi:alkylation response protein AidB-like acyl-CoA dehydrogenase